MDTTLAAQGPVDCDVRPVTHITPSELQYLLSSPHALRLLMDHADLMYSQAVSILEPGEAGLWPTKRWTALRERGRAIIAEDPEIWEDDILRAFGFEAPNIR